MSRDYKPYTGWSLFWDVFLFFITGSLWGWVILFRFLGRNSR